jgi:amidase
MSPKTRAHGTRSLGSSAPVLDRYSREPSISRQRGTVTDLLLRPATDLLGLLRSGELGAVELLELHLDRVRAVNPTLNAVVAIDEEGALEQARRADDARARQYEPAPLRGLPMTIKDVFEVVGMPATCGIGELAHHMPTRDADVVTALRDAGAVIFGKTNVPEGAGDHQSYNAIYGVTRNPWDLSRTPGGSSGGAAAALAAGMTPMEIGTDVGGSIRCPAHFCGVWGHKSSFTVVPMGGNVPTALVSDRLTEMLVAGPMARDARDLELALDVVAGPQGLDRKGKRWTLPRARQERLEDYRVAVLLEADGAPVDTAYRRVLEEYVEELRGAGVRTTTLHRPPVDSQHALDVYFDILFGIFGGGAPQPIYEAFKALAPEATVDDRSFEARMGRAARLTAREWFARLDERARLAAQWESFFTDVDILLCPVMSTVAFPHDTSGVDHTAQLHRTVAIDGEPAPYLINLTWPGLITVANLPSTAMPTGRLVNDLPAGIQAVGAYLEDRTTLHFATLVQERLGGFVPPPALDELVPAR